MAGAERADVWRNALWLVTDELDAMAMLGRARGFLAQ